jgi:hypothetical protein
MCQSLPVDILAQLLALGTALVQVAQQQRERAGTLADLEVGVRTATQAALAGLLGAVVPLATPDLDPAIATVRRRCPRCERLTGTPEQRERTLRTTCGSLTLTRSWYHCARGQAGFSPVDAALAVPPRARISPALQAWLVRLTVAAPPREAAAVRADLTGLVVHPDTLREHTTAVGAARADADEAAVARVQATREATEPVDSAPGTLVVETDGAMVRYRDGWHEVKLGVVGGTADGEVQAASYVAAREAAEQFGPRLLAEAARRGALEVVRRDGPLGGHNPAVLRPVHVVGEGAHWIWELAAAHFGERTEAVDFYHAAEHVWAVARAVYGSDSDEARVGATVAIRALRAVGAAPVRAALAASDAETADAAAVVRTERGYVATNADRMDYPALAAEGLPIGSGAVESSAAHVVQQRMKRPGQRWSAQGGRAMLALRARRASGRPCTLAA